MVSDFAAGTLLALGAAFCFGAHTSFAKVKSVRESQVAMPIYTVYFLVGAALVCFIEYFIMIGLGASIEFTYLGIICAFLLLCFETFLVLSIQQIGVGYASGSMVFASGVIAPIVQIILGQPIENIGVMVAGLLMLAFSVFLMSILRDALQFCGLKVDNSQPEMVMNNENEMVMNNGGDVEHSTEHTPLVSQDSTDIPELASQGAAAMGISRCQMLLGLLFSTLAGGFLAVLPLPSLYAAPSSAGVNFFLSFGVGCLIMCPLSALMVLFTEHGGPHEKERGVMDILHQVVTFDNDAWHFKQVIIPAMCGGIVWSVGNICGFMSFLYLSYTIAVSFVQCNVIVAMLLSIVLWREITNAVEIGVMCALSLLLVAGCAVVVYGVFGSFA